MEHLGKRCDLSRSELCGARILVQAKIPDTRNTRDKPQGLNAANMFSAERPKIKQLFAYLWGIEERDVIIRDLSRVVPKFFVQANIPDAGNTRYNPQNNGARALSAAFL